MNDWPETIRKTSDADTLDQAIDLAFLGSREEAGIPASGIELIKDFGETRVSRSRSRRAAPALAETITRLTVPI